MQLAIVHHYRSLALARESRSTRWSPRCFWRGQEELVPTNRMNSQPTSTTGTSPRRIPKCHFSLWLETSITTISQNQKIIVSILGSLPTNRSMGSKSGKSYKRPTMFSWLKRTMAQKRKNTSSISGLMLLVKREFSRLQLLKPVSMLFWVPSL